MAESRRAEGNDRKTKGGGQRQVVRGRWSAAGKKTVDKGRKQENSGKRQEAGEQWKTAGSRRTVENGTMDNGCKSEGVGNNRRQEARKLRELFKGRFSDDESLELLKEQGGLSDAVDFVLNSDPDEVRRLINDRNEALVEALRRDAAYIQTALTEGVEASIRLFSCQNCDNYWWRKVPARKEVSTCKICKTKYDPVPRDQEWGLAEFACVCGNVFWGSGWMNHTQSPCYNCLCLTCPTRIMPPTKPRSQRRRAEHSCTGTNCYNRAVPMGPNGPMPDLVDGGAAGGEGEFHLCSHHRSLCSHERSWRQRKVLYPSVAHVSTGSTVKTFMTQGELAEVYEDLQSLAEVPEADED